MNASFGKGQLIIMGAKQYLIEDRLPNGDISLKDLATNTYMAKPMDDLIKLYFNGHITIPTADKRLIERKGAKFLAQDFRAIPEELKNQAIRKYLYLAMFRAEGVDRKTAKVMNPIISAVAAIIEDPNPPHWTTAYRWDRDFVASGENIRVLVPMHKEKGKGGTVQEEVDKIIDKAIAKVYLNDQRLDFIDVFEEVQRNIEEENRFRDPDDKLSHISYSTVYRRSKKLNPYDVAKARYGKRYADLKYGVFRKNAVRPTRPLERVAFDHTKIDLFVIDEENAIPIGRPWLTLGVEYLTKVIFGTFLAFEPPSYLSVMQCMLHGIQPKFYVKDKYPSIKNTWDVYGVPEIAYVDNAKEFISTHLEEACLEIGPIVEYQPIKMPWLKAPVERYFKTLNRKLLHKQPGTTFSNFLDLEDYDPQKNAIISFNTLLEVVHKFIIDVYQYGKHRGIDDIPAKAWKRAMAVYPPALPCDTKSLNALLGMIYERTIQNSGIEFEGLFYADDNLAILRKRGMRSKNNKVKIKVDPTDLGFIHVFDDYDKIYIPVAAVHSAYASGITLWQHRVIRKYALKKLKNDTDVLALLKAKEEIQKIVLRDWHKIKIATKQKAARYLQIGLTQHKEMTGVDSGETNMKTPTQQLDPRRSIVRTESTGEALRGVSDVGTVISAPEVPDPYGQKGCIVQPNEQKTSSNKKTSGRDTTGRARKKKLPKSHPKKNLIEVATEEPEEEDLDLTGWEADYNLPRKGDGK